MLRKLITPPVLQQRPPKTGRIEIRDSISPLILRITAHGNRSFNVRARIKGRPQPVRLTYHAPAHASVLEEARAWAVTAVSECRRGIDPRAIRAKSSAAAKAEAERRERDRFGAVADRFLEKHASKNRSHAESTWMLDFYVRPGWEDRQIGDISRADVVALLDKIEVRAFEKDGKFYGGPVMADRVLAQVRKLMNWHAARDPSYVSPIVRGMARTKSKERARTRVLSDEEIRLIWPLLGECAYGGVVKMLFLTAQRLGEVAQMRRSQIDAKGIWAIPMEVYKGKRPQFVPLSREALSVVEAQTEIDASDLVFGASKDPRKLIKNWSDLKHDLDSRIAKANDGKAIPHWTLHDIRRTSRTLMSRAGVRPDISERVLGHAIPGVEGVYDRHAYVDEKRRALEALSALLERIITPPAENVIPLARRATE